MPRPLKRARIASLVPGLLAPAFVACSTNAGEGLPGKTESRAVTYLDGRVEEWHIPSVQRF